MSVRREKRVDPKTGETREFWRVDVKFQHPDGRRTRVRKVMPTQSKRAAEDYEHQVRAALLGGCRVQKEVPKFSKYSQDWMDTYVAANNSPGEQKNKRAFMRTYFGPALDRLRLDEITTTHIERIKARMVAAKLHPKTINNALGVLRTCLGHAVEAGHIARVPSMRRLKVPPRMTDFYSFDEADAVVAGATAGWPRRAILLALRTGVRQGEERGLQWDDVDFRSAQAHVQRSLSQDGTVARPPKNNRDRWVPLSPQALAVIKEQRADTMLRSKWVFCDDEGKPLTRAACEHQLKLACRKAGLRKIRWHDMRHTCASHLVMKGVPMRTVQEVLGHSTIGMTERYSHLAPDAKHEAVALLDERVSVPEADQLGPPGGHGAMPVTEVAGN